MLVTKFKDTKHDVCIFGCGAFAAARKAQEWEVYRLADRVFSGSVKTSKKCGVLVIRAEWAAFDAGLKIVFLVGF